jgi:hypothetical protein
VIQKSLLSKLSLRGSSYKPLSSRATDSAKIITANSDSSLNSNSNDTVQVFMACTTLNEDVKHIYKTKAKLCQSNLQHGWLIDSGAS